VSAFEGFPTVSVPGQLSGLLQAVLPDPALTTVLDAVGAADLELEGPTAARPLVAATIAGKAPLLAVTATGHEADDLTAALADLLGKDAVANFPSWETLPHERLSPRADTVGHRLEILHRLVRDNPPRVVVATVRSLIQPMAPGLGRLCGVLRMRMQSGQRKIAERKV